MILVLNAAEGLLQMLVLDHTKSDPILASAEIQAVSQGTEVLTPALQQLFTAHTLSFSDLQGIACVTGPGSFTGLRLVLSTAAALSRVNQAKLAPLNYLQLLAASIPAQAISTPTACIRVLTHAKAGLVHAADYNWPSLQELSPPQMLSINAEYLEQTLAPNYWLGSGVQKNLSLFSKIPTQKILDYPPTLKALAHLATQPLTWQDFDLEPMYLRPCDAELNLQ